MLGVKMIVSQLLADKIQSILGAQYKVVPFHIYIDSYAKPNETQYGEVYTIDYQAFKEDRDIIPVIVKTTPLAISSLPYVAKACNYEITFSVPLNVIERDENGAVLNTPEFDFFGDYNSLQAAVNNTKLTFNDEYDEDTDTYLKTYKGHMSISEPEFGGKEIDKSDRILWIVKGNIDISDTTIGMGEDVQIKLAFKNTSSVYVEYAFDNITDLTVSSDLNANENQFSESLGAEKEISTKSQGISFTVDDVITATDLAMQCVRNKAFVNSDILSANETDVRLQKKVRVKVYKYDYNLATPAYALIKDFWAVMTSEYIAASETSYASYKVSLSNDEKGV